MISISKATKIVLSETASLGSEVIPVGDAVGRVLAEDIRADSDMPPFDRSQMDGYAMKAKDTVKAPVELRVVGESAAGYGWHKTLRSGQAIRIMTGARVPSSADSVQKVELTQEKDGFVTIEEPTISGKYIVRRGAEIKKGAKLFASGDVIGVRMIASLAAFGYARVKVAKKPLVMVLSTGSEIVAVDKKPAKDQIRNSNSVMLKTLAETDGSRVKLLAPIGDDLEKLKKRIEQGVGSDSDMLVITGGVSVGKYDLTKLALRELGAEIYFERVRLRPGKPTVFGRLRNTLVFGLPGNPVSSAVTYYLFVRTALMKMMAASDNSLRPGFAKLTSPVRAAKERSTYFPAALDTDKDGTLLAIPLRWHGSSDFVGFSSSNALVVLERGETRETGETVQILFL